MSETMLREYLGKVERDCKRGIATEHTYRGTLQDLLQTLNSTITATNEPKRINCGAPDYVIERNRGNNTFTIGYVEAKDAGMNLDEIERDSRLVEPKTREGKQLKRYLHALDNLVFTNYLEFRWYLHGEKRATAILSTPQADRRLPFDREKAREVEQLLQSFLGHSAEPIRNPPELAKRMARLAHMIRDIIIDAFEQKVASDELKDLYSAFKEVLLPELTGAEFADMFAQTLAYGLFAARYNHKGTKPFNRNDAAKEIPRTNPFLRRLFGTIAGPDLDDELFVFPCLPLTSHVELFQVLCGLGERLVGLHLMEKFGSALPSFPIKDNDTVEKVEYTASAEKPELGRVWINKTQYFEGVAPGVWEFHVGGYQVCHKWLKDRKGRILTNSDKKHYQCIVAALAETITLMQQVDAAINERGGWPLE